MYDNFADFAVLDVELVDVEELEAKIAPDSGSWDVVPS
jgi:hypothetical protein